MATKTITAANSKFFISIPALSPVPFEVQGYAADDAFSVDGVDSAETMMGVDGNMSAGYTPFITPMTVTLQADSVSIDVFDQWLQLQKANKELFFAEANITLFSTGRSYILTKGALKNIKQVPDAKKVLQPVQYKIDWQDVTPVPIA